MRVIWPFSSWFRYRAAKRRRKRHKEYVRDTIFHLKYSLINLALACERGDLSLTGFNRKSLNRARLIRRYETKLRHLERLVG